MIVSTAFFGDVMGVKLLNLGKEGIHQMVNGDIDFI